jgi:hypothetical protein
VLFGRLWYSGPNAVANAIGYAEHRSRSQHAVIRVYNESGNVIETHEHVGEFKSIVIIMRTPAAIAFGAIITRTGNHRVA